MPRLKLTVATGVHVDRGKGEWDKDGRSDARAVPERGWRGRAHATRAL